MTDKEINFAILEHFGWYQLDNESTICWTNSNITYCLHEDELPDYVNDLNLMNLAELSLSSSQYDKFCDELYLIAVRDNATTERWTWLSSNADQRAEAFVKAIGKWKEFNER